MRKSYRFLTAWLIAASFSLTANAQKVTINGKVSNSTSKESVSAVSVLVKGTNQGTYTNPDGEFSITVKSLPVTLVFSSIGYFAQEVTVSDATNPLEVDFKVNPDLGQEVVVSANRVPQRILEAPVTVERMSSSVIRNVPAPSVYEAIGNLKGVDVHTASLTFRTVTTRGFVSSGNTRLNQLVEGMDNQAPGLNFSVSTIVGLADLDIDNIELLSGASSALYGSGGMNGTVLISSKNPFKYKGLSYNIKQGIMHVDGKQRTAAPYYNWAFRYANTIKNKFAYKFTAEIIKGNDWQADDYRNKTQFGILSKVAGGNRLNDPNFNGINVYGDETSTDMSGFALLVMRSTSSAITGNPSILGTVADAYFASQGNPVYPTNAQYASAISFIITTLGVPPAQQAAVAAALQNQFLPFYNGFKNKYFNGASISRGGYEEKLLVDYNTLNVKLNGGLHWKITEKIEASWNTYFGTGTTVYTGANRYSLRNFKMAQHKLEFNAKNWYLRGYTTQENAGDSYIADAVGAFLNEAYNPSGSWFPTYIGTFSEGRRQNALAGQFPSDFQLHNAARAAVETNRLVPGTSAFDAAAKKIKTTPVNKPGGAMFLDRSDLYAVEAQLNFSDAMRFSDKVEMLVGASWKEWVLNSKGTIFADTTGKVTVTEKGAYIQLKKKLLNDVLTLTASGRYDKQSNFEGKFTPRATATIKVAKENFLRLSYQNAYRFPSNQNQYISLRLGGGNSYLIGCLPEFQDYYKLSTTKPGYTAASVLDYRRGTIADSNRLVRAVFKEVKPETVNSFELGYKGILSKKMLIDAYAYYSKYQDFIINEAVAQALNQYKFEVYSPFTSNSLSYVQNSSTPVKALGWGIGIEYNIIKKYWLYGNLFSDELRDVPAGAVTYFNAPKYRYNIGLRNENVCHNIGFNVVVKWQDNNYYEGTFATGTLPYFTWVDAQITYRPPNTKSVFRAGGTNLGNNYYRTGYGSPAVGGLYYVSYGFNL
ncbi:MAG: carboxypeptidase-like regulatory domain-containing protein [Sphingobacteriales bacterium]|nr:carboxypeptidase-like regulatory domain-containing protein [Sphingobacteriales bacterium]